jgi:hypothetical protein
MQMSVLSCIPCQRSFLRNFVKKYVSTVGIQFVEKFNEIQKSYFGRSRTDDRNLLKEYYIDIEMLELLKKEKLKYKLENGQLTENGKSNENDIEKAMK